MRFVAPIETAGRTATGIEVPTEVVESLGSSRRPAVRVTLRNYTYRTSIASMGGRFMLPVSAEVRQGAGVQGGDEVEVDLELDTELRSVEVPADLASALAADAKAQGAFASLSYSNQRRLVLAVGAAKTEATRQRRVEGTVRQLAGGETGNAGPSG